MKIGDEKNVNEQKALKHILNSLKKNLLLQFKLKLDYNPDYQCFREYILKTLP